VTLTIDTNLQAQALSVQNRPPVGAGSVRFGGYNLRNALLPPPGTREREYTLRQYRHNPYSTLFRAASAGIVKRIQTLPFIIRASDVDTWQDMLMRADFGSWDRLVDKTVGNYLYHDAGAWIELIAPGDPRFAPDGPIVGIAAMDTLRVYPTGNATYPAIYYDHYGKMHLMHHTRVMQLVDNEYAEEYLAGYGECAQTRAISPIRREILINQYIESFLDDKPRPGVRIWQNVNENMVEAAFVKMEMDKQTDDGGEWGHIINIYALDSSEEADVKEYNNTKAPEGFDLDKYKNETALEIAACLGVDIQDFWQLVSSGLGTGTQSEIMAQKSRGKTLGNLIKRLTRAINQAFPPRVEFSFEYSDPQEDQEEANKANSWANTITIVSSYLKPEEIRQLMANQIPAFKDVLLDVDGNLRRLDDEDLEPVPGEITDDDGTMGQLLENYVEDGTLTGALENYLGGVSHPISAQGGVTGGFSPTAFPAKGPAETPSGNEGAPVNVDSTEGLNGAQITAALEILHGLEAGTTAPTVASELLMALGISPERVDRMVNATVHRMGLGASNESTPAHADTAPAQPSSDLSDLLERFTQKSFTGTGVDFSKYLRSFMRVGQAQNFPGFIMRATFREELYNAGVRAYDDGMMEGGADPATLDAVGQVAKNRKIGEWLALQNGYINGLVDDINTGVVNKDNIRSRSDLWVSKSLRAIFHTGLLDAAGEKLYTFRLGATEEHCKTCTGANGQTHKLKDFFASGIYPGSSSLECKGFNCSCRFEEAAGKPSGRLPGAPSGLFGQLTDALGGFLRRLVG
jgi:hypothetical protein